MSDLQPKGTPVEINGEERHFLFTLSVIDEIQSAFPEIERDGEAVDNPNILEIFIYIFGKNAEMKDYKDFCKIVAILLNDEAERNRRFGGKEFQTVTAEDLAYLIDLESVSKITNAIMQAYGLSMPEPSEDEDPNVKSGQNS